MTTDSTNTHHAGRRWEAFCRIRDRKHPVNPKLRLLFFCSRQTDDKVILYYANRMGDVLEPPYVCPKITHLAQEFKNAEKTCEEDLGSVFAPTLGISVEVKHEEGQQQYMAFLNSVPEKLLRLRLKRQTGNVTITGLVENVVIPFDGKIFHIRIEDAEIFNVHTVETLRALSVEIAEFLVFARVTKHQIYQALQAQHGEKYTAYKLSNDTLFVQGSVVVTEEMKKRFSILDALFKSTASAQVAKKLN